MTSSQTSRVRISLKGLFLALALLGIAFAGLGVVLTQRQEIKYVRNGLVCIRDVQISGPIHGSIRLPHYQFVFLDVEIGKQNSVPFVFDLNGNPMRNLEIDHKLITSGIRNSFQFDLETINFHVEYEISEIESESPIESLKVNGKDFELKKGQTTFLYLNKASLLESHLSEAFSFDDSYRVIETPADHFKEVVAWLDQSRADSTED